MCMCRSTSISGRSASRRASAGSPVSRVPSRGQAAVDLLELRRGVLSICHQAVVAREVVAHELGGRRQACGARVQAAEEALHEAAGHERREQTLGGGVEGAHVERARVAQSGVGGARGERLVHVDEVELDGAQQFLDRARHVDRQRRGSPAGIAGPPGPRNRAPPRPRSRGVRLDRFRRAGIAALLAARRAAPCARRAPAPASATGRAPARGGRVARALRRRAPRGR